MKIKRRRIIIDICHPAEVHHFKYVYRELRKRGWRILFVAKRKDVSEALLKAYGLPYCIFSESKKGLFKKILQLPLELWRFAKIVRRFRPTFIISNLSVHSCWISYTFRITHIAFVDTEHRRLLDYVTMPFADVKLTPDAYKRSLGPNHYRYAGNHEVSYLHPLRFQPNAAVKKRLGVSENEKYVILRFVSWQAFHDVGMHGLELAKKLQLVQRISEARTVFISSETALPEALRRYQMKIPAHDIHDALYYADAYIGEGATMASEAACLGTPAIYLNKLKLGYCEEEARFGLLRQVDALTPQSIRAILNIGKTEQIAKSCEEFWQGKIDVTAFIVHFFVKFPASLVELEQKSAVAKESYRG